jgi:RNA polymerase sigma-70 factor (ECF subfamily)
MHTKKYKKFLILYNEFFDKIYQYVYYRTGRDRQIAEDLTSEIFLKALEKFTTFDEEVGSFNSWIYMISQNHVIDFYRTQKKLLSLDEISDVPERSMRINEKLQIKEQYNVVLTAIHSLPESYQEILILKYINQLSNKEIAEILSKTQVSIRVTLHRAIKALMSTLNKRNED